MKKIIVFIVLYILFCLSLNAQNNNEPLYYYYQGEKIYLQQKENMIFLKFAPNANNEQINSIIRNSVFLKPMNDRSSGETFSHFVILETPNMEAISLNTIESYKAIEEIVSATYVFQYNAALQGLTDEFVIKLKEGVAYAQLEQLAEQHNCVVVKENQFVKNQFLISISKASDLNAMQMSNLFYESELFEFSEPNFIIINAFHSYDTYFDQQWGLKNTGQFGGTIGIDIKAEQAWTIAQGSSNIKIAVVDLGVDLTHPDLQANLLQGYDATGHNAGGAPVYSDDKHGTTCAGIIGAIKDNNIGISGVSPNCKIMPINVSIGNSHLGADFAADGIQWAWRNGADVISNSWGDASPYTPITNAIDSAVERGRNGNGCVVVFSSGNMNSTVAYPAKLPNVIAVGAMSPCGERKRSSKHASEVNSGVSTDPLGVSCDGEIKWGSNYGAELDVVAPGVKIYTTDIQGSAGYTNGDYYSGFGGTSAACPHVAGVAALILSVNPCLTQQEVRNLIELSCEKVGPYCYQSTSEHPNGTWNEQTGYGLVNAYKALQYAHSSEIHSFNNISGSIYGSATSSYTWVLSQRLCTTLSAGTYFVQRTEVRATVSYPYTASPVIVGSAKGFSSTNPNDSKRYIGIVNISETNATVNTYVYAIYDVSGRYLGTHPNSATDVRFDFKVLSAFGTDVYLQNQTVGTTIAQSAIHNIYAGNNVTDAVSTGDYTIQNGANVNFHAGDAIFLKPGFHAQEGSTFHAGVEPYFTCEQFPSNVYSPYDNNDVLSDYVIANYNVENFTSQTEKTPEEDVYFKVYPNPASDYINIEYSLNRSEMVEIILYNNSGHILYRLKNRTMHEAGVYSIHLSGLALHNGIYHCVLQTENRKESAKIIIQ